jgi:hypothetical protein
MAISARASGTWATISANGSTVSIPAGGVSGDRMYLLVAFKNYNKTITTPTGWTYINGFNDGTVAAGNGVGSMRLEAYYKDVVGDESNPTLTFNTWTVNTDIAGAVINIFQKNAGETWNFPTIASGAITNWTTSAQFVNASATVTVPNDSLILGLSAIRDDSANYNRFANSIVDVAATIVWNGNFVEYPAAHLTTTTSNDMAADVGYRLVTTGAAGSTLRQSATISASETGAAMWIIQTVTGGAQNLSRTASDTVTTVTDAVNRVITFARSAIDYAPSPRYPIAVNALSPIAHWRFGEASGSTATAVVGPNLTYAGGVTYGVTTPLAGDPDTAVTFSRGTTGYAFSASSVASGSVGFSFSAWIKFGTINAGELHTILSWGDQNAAQGFHWLYYEQATATLRLQYANGAVVVVNGAWTADTNWHLITFSQSYTGAIKIWVDRTTVLSTTTSGTPLTVANTEAIRIGQYVGGGTNSLNASVDEPALFNFALTESQHLELYESGLYTVRDSIAHIIGTIIARTASDTVTAISDSVNRMVSLIRGATDTPTAISDSIARVNNKLRTAADTVTTVTDSVVRVITIARTAVDTVTTATDSVVRAAANKVRTATDTVTTVTDSVVRAAANKIRTAADSVTTSDAVVRIVTIPRTVSDTVATVTDSIVRVANKIRTAVDTVTTTDAIARVNNKLRTAADTVTTVTDSLVRQAISFARTTSDSVTTSDAVVRTFSTVRTAVDTVVTSDTVARAISLFRAATDTTTVSDSANKVMSAARTAVDTVTTVTDSVFREIFSGAQQFYRTASDTVSIGADTVGRTISALRTLSDTTSVSDAVTRTANKLRSAVDTITTSDAVTRIYTAVRSATDTTSVSDSVSRVVQFIRSASDAIPSVSDVVTGVRAFVRSLSDSVTTSDVVSRQWQGFRSAVDTIPTVIDNVSTNLAVILYRTAVDTVSIGADLVSRTVSAARSATDTVTTSDSVARVLSYVRAITDTVPTVVDTVVRGSISIWRSATDSVSVTDFVTVLTGAPKYVGELIRDIVSGNRFKVGQDDHDNNVGGGTNRIRVRGSSNKEKVR